MQNRKYQKIQNTCNNTRKQGETNGKKPNGEEIQPLLAIILTMGIVGYPRVRLVIYFTEILELTHKIEIIGAQSGHSITEISLLSCLVEVLNSS